jgi:hypothetical protein
LLRRILFLLILLCAAPALTLAQDDARALTLGQPVEGVIDADHALRVYTAISVSDGSQRAQIRNTGVASLAVTVIDDDGNTLNTLDPLPGGAQADIEWTASAATTSYLMILTSEDIADHRGSFTVTLLQPLTLATAGALQFDLIWQAGARLSLEVRDPQGQSLHWRSIQTPDGGVFVGGEDEPINCALFSPRVQRQTAIWQQATAGSYEILVHYLDGCEPNAPFTLTARLGSREVPAINSTVQTDETFVAGVSISENASLASLASSGIVSQNALNIPTADLLAQAQPLPPDGSVENSISNGQPFRSYSFEGNFGDQVAVELTKTSGNLDTLVALMDANGNLLALNDDFAEGSTDSALGGVRLRRAGTYLIVVTRYAQLLGATEGSFALITTGIGGSASP